MRTNISTQGIFFTLFLILKVHSISSKIIKAKNTDLQNDSKKKLNIIFIRKNNQESILTGNKDRALKSKKEKNIKDGDSRGKKDVSCIDCYSEHRGKSKTGKYAKHRTAHKPGKINCPPTPNPTQDSIKPAPVQTPLPTPIPTLAPTPLPTLSPTPQPTLTPTPIPSNFPTSTPSSIPSNAPTTASSILTIKPTREQNAKSLAPSLVTFTLSLKPTLKPSLNLTQVPESSNPTLGNITISFYPTQINKTNIPNQSFVPTLDTEVTVAPNVSQFPSIISISNTPVASPILPPTFPPAIVNRPSINPSASLSPQILVSINPSSINSFISNFPSQVNQLPKPQSISFLPTKLREQVTISLSNKPTLSLGMSEKPSITNRTITPSITNDTLKPFSEPPTISLQQALQCLPTLS